jgi:hypothetical protein
VEQSIPMEQQTKTLKGRFEELKQYRQPFDNVAERAAELTLPYIFRRDGQENTPYELGWQNLGARGVNHLASKLMLSLFPPTGGFFKFVLDETVKQSLPPNAIKNADNYTNIAEAIMLQELNKLQVRPVLNEAVKHVIITGNVALWFMEDNLKLYSLKDYVVMRDKAMNLVEIILRETVDFDALPLYIRGWIIKNKIQESSEDWNFDKGNPQYTIYTGAKLINGTWEMWQEINGVEIEGTRKKVKRLPILVLRWTNTLYGHGFVEQIMGDLESLESLSQALTEGALTAARTIFLARPNGMVDINELISAQNGDIIEGEPEDVGVLQMQKYADFRVALERALTLEDRLNQMFLVFSPRDAERVTAEEIRRLTEELESLLGGVYTLLADELQRPLLEILFDRLLDKGILEEPPNGDIQVVLTSGFEALSRTTNLNKLLTLLQAVMNIPNALQYINWNEYLNRVVNALNLEPKGLIFSEEELMAKQQALMEMQIQQTAAQEGAKAALQKQQQ